MKALSRRAATYQDLLDAPENMVAELIDGDLYTWQRPAGPHADMSSVLGMLIGFPYRLGRGGPGGWWIVDEPELHLGEQVVVPDLAGWRRERMPRIPKDHRFVIPPEWVCEVISPSTARIDRGRKMDIYSEHDVAWLWIIDPIARLFEMFTLESERWSRVHTYSGNDVVRAEPFPEAEIDLASIWGTDEEVGE
ncbi:MAG TPA: Uma2 family endonuclease [Thermoanaerobaculia bacterium]|jgi:Uma2 family endonuclease|nr:Uma2 family endonuclease [Thermoanaerobaculia bacterium]